MHNRLHILCIFAALSLAVACGTQERVEKNVPLPGRTDTPGHRFETVPEGWRTKESLPLYYYVEGLKAANIYGDNEKAVELFARSIVTDSTFSPAYYAAANASIGDPKTALRYSLTANALDEDDMWARTQLGRLLVVNGDYSGALPIFQSLIEQPKADPDSYRMLAALHEVSGRPFAAIAVLDSAETRYGKFEELAAFKRGLLIKVNLTDLAIAESEGLAEEYPYEPENHLILGDLYLRKRSDSLALASINRAAELSPTGIEPLTALNEYYKTVGDNKNFLATVKQIFRHDDVDQWTKIHFFKDLIRDKHYYAANYFSISDIATTLRVKYPHSYEVAEVYAGNLLAAGEIEQALNVYKDYLSDTTSVISPYQMIIEGETVLGRPDSVNKYTELALKRFPGNAELHIGRGVGLQYMNRDKEAIAAYRQAFKLADTDSVRSVVMGFMGDAYHKRNKMGKTYGSYESALRYDRNNVLTLNNYAYCLSEENRDLDKALDMAERVMELEPGNAVYIDTYGWVLFRLGRYEEAKKAMIQAISLDTSSSPEHMLHYGDILLETGDEFMARYYWEKARDAGYDTEKIDERIAKITGK